MTYAPHPIANTFPLIDGPELDQLIDDIRAHGLREPILLYQGNVLDGRNRLRACEAAGVDPVFRDFEGDDPLGYVVSLNVHRRHLTESQRAMVAARIANLRQGARTDLTNLPSVGGRSQADAAAMLNVGTRSVERAAAVQDAGDASLVAAVDAGRVRVSAAREIARLPVEEQRVLLERADPDEILRRAKDIRATRRAERDAANADLKLHNPPPPSGKYRCLVLDPPWPMRRIELDDKPNEIAGLDYPTMTLDEIAALPIGDLAADDGCHLYVWTTQKYVPAGLRLLDAWGFNYVCQLTWVKPGGMTPFSWCFNAEHVLFGTRGNLPLQRMGLKLTFDAPTRRHSEKPDVFFDRVLQASPEPRLEMFARTRREGFKAWGNEVEESLN